MFKPTTTVKQFHITTKMLNKMERNQIAKSLVIISKTRIKR